jgi:hypothetical protein
MQTLFSPLLHIPLIAPGAAVPTLGLMIGAVASADGSAFATAHQYSEGDGASKRPRPTGSFFLKSRKVFLDSLSLMAVTRASSRIVRTL